MSPLNVLLLGQSGNFLQESFARWTTVSRGPEYRSQTFAHVTDALLEDIVAVAVHMGAQEILEAVVDLQSGAGHAHPLAHRVALKVL